MTRLRVASFTDAWIETLISIAKGNVEKSHLLQMRGLKPTYDENGNVTGKSHLLQMRGLKHILLLFICFNYCRIFYRCVD